MAVKANAAPLHKLIIRKYVEELIMKKQTITLLSIVMIIAAGCASKDKYPVSGEECGPNDPVKKISSIEPCPRY